MSPSARAPSPTCWPAPKAPLTVAATTIAQEVRNAKVVASDETSARVGGKTWWQWVLLSSSTAVYHVIAAHRSAAVVSDFLGGAIPEVWVADRYAAQAGHGAQRQVCLAHLLRDAQFAIDAGDAIFAAGFRKAAVAIDRYWSAPRRSEGHDLGSVSRRSRPSPRPLAGCRPDGSRRPQTRPRHRQMPRRSLCPSSLDATFPTPTTGANGRCGPASSFATSPAASDPAGAPASTPQPFPSSLPDASTAVPPFRPFAIPSPASPSLHQPQHRGEQLPKSESSHRPRWYIITPDAEDYDINFSGALQNIEVIKLHIGEFIGSPGCSDPAIMEKAASRD